MSEAHDQAAEEVQRRAESAEASVGYAGEPSGSLDARDLPAAVTEGPSPEDLDAREERFTGPRKPMGPPGGDNDSPETTPEDSEN